MGSAGDNLFLGLNVVSSTTVALDVDQQEDLEVEAGHVGHSLRGGYSWLRPGPLDGRGRQ